MDHCSPSFHSSAETVIADLKNRFPHSPFLALGQTALWDEPTKAAFRCALDRFWPEARLIAAAHDSDYFAKLPGHPAGRGDAKFALLPHDDAATRGLWSAAGEMSRLFGSEDVPTQHKLEKAGVSLHRATGFTEEADAFLSEATTAWGWTGIVHTESGRRIAHDIPLKDILPTLLEQIEWAVRGSAENLLGDAAAEAHVVAGTIRGWIHTFASANPSASLSDLYRDLFPRFYELVSGAPPANLSTSNTLRLLRFNRETCTQPRFATVDAFLRPATRQAALDAYNLAVAGTEMYTLDRFGDGALPFDLVIPGKGRGTLCVRHDSATVVVQTEPPHTLCGSCEIGSIAQLAELVERELGPNVALVGKAVSLISMLSSEFALVMHEGASGYTHRTRQFNANLAKRGVALPPLHPILRLRYATWDALHAVPNASGTPKFSLPPHLAKAFRRDTISAAEFADCWNCAGRHAQRTVDQLAALRSPKELMHHLAQIDSARWEPLRAEYDTARVRLLALRDRGQAIQGRIYTLYDQVRALRTEIVRIEREKGDDFRARVQPLRDEPGNETRIDALQAERSRRFDHEIAQRISQVKFALATIADLKEKRLTLERGAETATARETLRRIEAEAERAKAVLVRDAIAALESLPHTNFRPSAWWFPLVDPSGAWFRRLGETAEYHLEELVG